MELDDLKGAWQRLEQQLESQQRLSTALLAEHRASRLQAALRPLFWWQVVQLVTGVALASLAARFWLSHLETTVLVASGIVVHVYAVLLIVNGARVLLRLGAIDYGAPVTVTQKQVAQLERTYVVSGWVLGLPWWLLWIPVSLMLLQTAGIDVLSGGASGWLTANIIVGVVGMLATVALVLWARRSSRPGVRAYVDRIMAGATITNARQHLEQIEQFEREGAPDESQRFTS